MMRMPGSGTKKKSRNIHKLILESNMARENPTLKNELPV
jgi:hypothetical protein